MDGREDAASSSRKVQNNLFRGAVTRTGTPASAAEGLASKKSQEQRSARWIVTVVMIFACGLFSNKRDRTS